MPKPHRDKNPPPSPRRCTCRTVELKHGITRPGCPTHDPHVFTVSAADVGISEPIVRLAFVRFDQGLLAMLRDINAGDDIQGRYTLPQIQRAHAVGLIEADPDDGPGGHRWRLTSSGRTVVGNAVVELVARAGTFRFAPTVDGSGKKGSRRSATLPKFPAFLAATVLVLLTLLWVLGLGG